MFNGKKILAFTGARGGSKGLPQKNILDFHGKPLIEWTYLAAKGSKYIDDHFFSTDCSEVQDTIQSFGGDAPILRPSELATDSAKIAEAIFFSLHWLKQHRNKVYDFVILLQPTSPLRNTIDIDQSLEQYFLDSSDSRMTLVSVYKAPPKVGWLLQSNLEGNLEFCFAKDNARRQTLKEYYLPNGAIYIASLENFDGNFYSTKTKCYIMPEERSVDVDTIEDFRRAEQLFTKPERKALNS